MAITLAFDVYGTLIDTQGVVGALRALAGDRAGAFASAWRDKQLEYAFRRGLMQNYVDFAACTRQALDYTCAAFGIDLDEAHRQALLDSYRRLPAFADVREGLARLPAERFRCYAFSNGSAAAVAMLLESAGIADFFVDIVSVDDLKTFKPNPAVYSYFLRRSGAVGGDAWLISSNPFDVIGAISAGMRAAWLRRSPAALFDPWEIAPSLTLDGLADLGARIAAASAAATD
jgi:2-haloacid dehalogenase